MDVIVKENFPGFGPKLPKKLDEKKTLEVSELLAVIVKGFERGYSKE